MFEGKVESGEELCPLGLSSTEVLRFLEIFEVSVIGPYFDLVCASFEVVSPGVEGSDNRK